MIVTVKKLGLQLFITFLDTSHISVDRSHQEQAAL